MTTRQGREVITLVISVVLVILALFTNQILLGGMGLCLIGIYFLYLNIINK